MASAEQWRPLVASIWPSSQVDNCLAVMACESGGNPNAHNTNGEDSRGLMQINVGPGAHTNLAGLNLFDPATNLQAALQIWQASGWSPWTCARNLGIAGGGSVIGSTGGSSSGIATLLLSATILYVLSSVLED